MDKIQCRQLPEDIDIARDEVVFRDDLHRIAVLQEHPETAACQFQTAFDRLIGIRVAGKRDGLRFPGFALKGLFEKLCGIRLDDNP